MKLYCSCCDKMQPVFVDDCKDAKTNKSYQDIVCSECFLVIASGTGIEQPVRTKDLTDAEIAALVQRHTIDGKIMPFVLCEAVIAADREKNK